MAYHNTNHRQRKEEAVRLTRLYYEPGRQDRCFKWVWRKYIREQFHVEYRTYLGWLREFRKETGIDFTERMW